MLAASARPTAAAAVAPFPPQNGSVPVTPADPFAVVNSLTTVPEPNAVSGVGIVDVAVADGSSGGSDSGGGGDGGSGSGGGRRRLLGRRRRRDKKSPYLGMVVRVSEAVALGEHVRMWSRTSTSSTSSSRIGGQQCETE